MILAIASGKGGTGKTTVAVNLARVLERPLQLLDCDVEEPNSHLFLPGDRSARKPSPSRCPKWTSLSATAAANAAASAPTTPSSPTDQAVGVRRYVPRLRRLHARMPQKGDPGNPKAHRDDEKAGRQDHPGHGAPRCRPGHGAAAHPRRQGTPAIRACPPSWMPRPGPHARSSPPSAGRILFCWSPSRRHSASTISSSPWTWCANCASPLAW